MKNIIIGYTSRGAHDWQRMIEPPQVPKTYADGGAKEERWMLEFYSKLSPQFTKMTGVLTSVFAVDLSSKEVFHASSSQTDKLASAFLSWLLKRADFPREPTVHNREISFYGFNPKPLLRMTGINAMREGYPDVPLGVWYMNDNCYDPAEMLLETEMKKVISINTIAEHAPGGKIEIPPAYQPHENAELDALIAFELACRYQLIEPDHLADCPEFNVSQAVSESPDVKEAEADDDEEAASEESNDTEAGTGAAAEERPKRKKKETKKAAQG